MASKRDYYEILGVSREVTRSWRWPITRIATRVMKKPSNVSKKPLKHLKFWVTIKNVPTMIAMDTLISAQAPVSSMMYPIFSVRLAICLKALVFEIHRNAAAIVRDRVKA